MAGRHSWLGGPACIVPPSPVLPGLPADEAPPVAFRPATGGAGVGAGDTEKQPEPGIPIYRNKHQYNLQKYDVCMIFAKLLLSDGPSALQILN